MPTYPNLNDSQNALLSAIANNTGETKPKVGDGQHNLLYKIAQNTYATAVSGGGGGGAVASVNGKTGVVTLNATDIGLGNVDNTSDLNKPISTATQDALDEKADGVLSLSDGLIAAYNLSNTSDSSGNGNTLTNNNGVTFSAGKIGNAAIIDANGEFLSTDLAVPNSDWTISAWVYADNPQPDPYSTFIFNQDLSTSAYCNSTETAFYFGASVASVNTSILGQWAHVVFGIKNGGSFIRLNDSIQGTGSLPSPTVNPLRFGSNTGGGGNNKFTGKLDAIGIWNRALTDAEITELYNAGAGREYPYSIIAGAAVELVDKSDGSAAISKDTTWTIANPTSFRQAAGITTGSVDNAVLRADGTGGDTLQGSDIVITDASTSTEANIAITNQHSGQTNSSLVLTPKGTGALIAGPRPDGTAAGGNARGIYSVDLQTIRSAASMVASGQNSVICGGQDNTASDLYASVGGGVENAASNTYAAISGGLENTASGVSSFVGGGEDNTASGAASSVCGGYQAVASQYGQQAHAAGSFASLGDAQRSRYVLRCKTTTNTGVEMALDGSTDYLNIPSGKIIACTINITGSKSDGTAVAHYLRQYCVKNLGGTSSEVYAPITIGTDNAAGTTIALSVNNTDDTLRILVTGVTSETWRWVASVDAVELGYGS